MLRTMKTDEARTLLASAREWLARGEWQEARRAFEAVRGLVEDPEVLEGLGMAAWWLDDAEAVFGARERAYQLYRRRGDPRGAARMAMTLAMDSFHFRGQTSVARGWQRRAATLLEGLPGVPEQAWLRVWDCELSLATGQDTARVREVAAEAVAIGRALGDPDAEMMALSLEGLALVMQGAVEDGMRQLDEVATAALSGDMRNPLAIGISCCHLVSACEIVRDFGRAAEWCERVREFSARLRWSVLSSVCRIQHAAVLMWNDAWSDAETELEQALRHLAGARPSMQEEALIRLAELRRRQGRFEEAEALLERVDWHPHGRLVRAAIALERGQADLAADHARRFLDQAAPSNRTDRALAGELLLRAELTLGRTPDARTLEDLEQLAAGAGTDPLRASARIAGGLMAAATGQHERARTAFEDAIALLARGGARYETARARVDLARSLLALGRAEAASTELERAARVFAELGAAGDLRAARALMDRPLGESRVARSARPGGLSARELDVLRLMAEGLSNPQIARRLVVSEFTVKRHVANILTKLDLPTRAAAAAYAARERWI
jgi:ATP/maltotriose-dependent transcriptional regulator MalT